MAIAAGLCAMAHDAAAAARRPHARGRRLPARGRGRAIAHGDAGEPRHQPVALSLWGTFVPVGIALAGIATASFRAKAGWRMIFAVDARALVGALLLGPRHGLPVSRRRILDWRSPPGCAARRLAARRVVLLLRAALPRARRNAAGLSGRPSRTCRPRPPAASSPWPRRSGSPAASRPAGLMHRGTTPGRLIAIGLAASTARGDPRLPARSACRCRSRASRCPSRSAAWCPPPPSPRCRGMRARPRAIGPINGLLAQAGSLGSLAGPPVLACGSTGRDGRWRPCCCLPSPRSRAAAALAGPRR